MKKNLVSIIIPLYNAENYIEDTINSILKQTINNYEIIIVDDKSTDKSIEIVNKFKDKRIIVYKSNIKLYTSGARNIGINLAKGEYICFLDADDLWKKTKLEKQLNFMKENKCAFSFTGYEFADNNGISKGKKVYVPYKLNYNDALKNTIIWTCTVMFDMNKIKKQDIYMPPVKSEDTACWWKILKKGYTAYGLNEILSYYRRNSNTLSANKLEAIRRVWYLYRKQENLSILKSIYNFNFYAFNAVKKRI